MSKNVFQLMRGLNLVEPDPAAMWSILERELNVLHITKAERAEAMTGFYLAFWSHEGAPERAKGEAFIFHPWRSAIRMIRIQHRLGIRDVRVILDLLLHDSVEDAKKAGKNPMDVHDAILEKMGEPVIRDVLHLTQMSHEGETDDEFVARIVSSREWRPNAAKLVERTDNVKTIRYVLPAKQTAKIRGTEKWLDILFTTLKAAVNRDIASDKLPQEYAHLPQVLYGELRRALRKEKKRLKIP